MCVNTDLSHMYIFQGALYLIQDPHELAFIIALELGHVLASHGKEADDQKFLEWCCGIPYLPAGLCGAGCSVLMMVSSEPLLIVGPFLLLPLSVGYWLRQKTKRTQVEEADINGLLLTTEAGFDPRAAGRTFDKMKRERLRLIEELKKKGNLVSDGSLPSWLQTHPKVSWSLSPCHDFRL